MSYLGPEGSLLVKGLHQGGQFGRLCEVVIVYEETVIIFTLSSYVGHEVLEAGNYLFESLLICGMRRFCRVEMNFVNSFSKDSGIRPTANSIGHFLQEIHTLIVAEVSRPYTTPISLYIQKSD